MPAISCSLAEKGQDEERVARPARRSLDLAALREPPLGLGLVARFDGERGQPVIAGEQQLGLADRARHLERFPIVPRTLRVIAPALVDLRQDDEGYRQVAVLPQPAIYLHRGLGSLDALVVVA